MKKTKFAVSILLALVLMLSLGVFAACNNDSTPEKTVTGIEVTAMPKTEYYVGDALSLAGGKLTVTYDDNTSEILDLTDEGVDVNISEINMSNAGTKTLTVRYEGQRTTFKITVSIEGLSVTFNYNYEGAEPEVKSVNKGTRLDKPADPVRGDYSFEGWFTDETLTFEYDFNTRITDSIKLYALWILGDYNILTLDYNYYGVNLHTMKIQDDTSPRLPSSPERNKFEFEKWYSDAACTIAFDFSKSLSADTTIYAGWTRKDAATDIYVFEAEETDLTYLKGPGISGDSSGKNTIVSDVNASKGEFVSFMYRKGNSIEFYIGCNEEVTDVTLVVRISAEIAEVTYIDSNLFEVNVNGTAQSYERVELECGEDGTSPGEWIDVEVATGLKFNKGLNTIKLTTINDIRPSIGATYDALAPVIDCVKLTTSAALVWDGTRGLPWDRTT